MAGFFPPFFYLIITTLDLVKLDRFTFESDQVWNQRSENAAESLFAKTFCKAWKKKKGFAKQLEQSIY